MRQQLGDWNEPDGRSIAAIFPSKRRSFSAKRSILLEEERLQALEKWMQRLSFALLSYAPGNRRATGKLVDLQTFLQVDRFVDFQQLPNPDSQRQVTFSSSSPSLRFVPA